MGSLRKDFPKKLAGHGLLLIDTKSIDNGAIQELNHSPLESPPMLKKRLRRLGSALLGGGSINANSLPPEMVMVHRQAKSGATVDNNNSHKTLNKSASILKRESLRKARAKSGTSNKKVKFDNDVTVHIMDDEGHLCTQCKELNNDNKCRKDFIRLHRENSRRSRNSCLSTNSKSPAVTDFAFGAQTEDPYSGQTNAQIVDANGNQLLKANSPQMSITFEQDPEHGTKLKFLAFLGKEYQPDNIVVKANMHGSRIRVLATKMTTLEDGRQVAQEFNERYALPMNVDPFSVEAKLDSKGYLTVIAPLMTLTRQQAPKSPSVASSEE